LHSSIGEVVEDAGDVAVAVVAAQVVHHLSVPAVCEGQTFVPFLTVSRVDVDWDVLGGVAEGHIVDVDCIWSSEVVDEAFGGADAGVADARDECGDER